MQSISVYSIYHLLGILYQRI